MIGTHRLRPDGNLQIKRFREVYLRHPQNIQLAARLLEDQNLNLIDLIDRWLMYWWADIAAPCSNSAELRKA